MATETECHIVEERVTRKVTRHGVFLGVFCCESEFLSKATGEPMLRTSCTKDLDLWWQGQVTGASPARHSLARFGNSLRFLLTPAMLPDSHRIPSLVQLCQRGAYSPYFIQIIISHIFPVAVANTEGMHQPCTPCHRTHTPSSHS